MVTLTLRSDFAIGGELSDKIEIEIELNEEE